MKMAYHQNSSNATLLKLRSLLITLYKKKGDCSDYNNYQDISLLSIVGKFFAKVVLTQPQVLAHQIYSKIPL